MKGQVDLQKYLKNVMLVLERYPIKTLLFEVKTFEKFIDEELRKTMTIEDIKALPHIVNIAIEPMKYDMQELRYGGIRTLFYYGGLDFELEPINPYVLPLLQKIVPILKAGSLIKIFVRHKVVYAYEPDPGYEVPIHSIEGTIDRGFWRITFHLSEGFDIDEYLVFMGVYVGNQRIYAPIEDDIWGFSKAVESLLKAINGFDYSILEKVEEEEAEKQTQQTT